MRIIRAMMILIFLFLSLGTELGFGQSIPLDKLKTIIPMVSSRSDVERILGAGESRENSAWYKFSDESVEIVYSDGACREGWLVPKGKVVNVSANFLKAKKFTWLKANTDLSKLRKVTTSDVEGERYYFDDERGIRYDVNEQQNVWISVTYYPGGKYSQAKCDD